MVGNVFTTAVVRRPCRKTVPGLGGDSRNHRESRWDQRRGDDSFLAFCAQRRFGRTLRDDAEARVRGPGFKKHEVLKCHLFPSIATEQLFGFLYGGDDDKAFSS